MANELMKNMSGNFQTVVKHPVAGSIPYQTSSNNWAWTLFRDLAQPTAILQSSSVAATQEPVTTDTPIQIEFGPAIDTTDASLAADGTVTINEDNIYIFKIILHFGRSGSPGTSELRFRALLNDLPVGHTEAIKLTDSDFVGRVFDYGELFLPAGTTLKYKMYRDSSGHDSGGLFQSLCTLAGWNDSPTATVIIQKR